MVVLILLLNIAIILIIKTKIKMTPQEKRLRNICNKISKFETYIHSLVIEEIKRTNSDTGLVPSFVDYHQKIKECTEMLYNDLNSELKK